MSENHLSDTHCSLLAWKSQRGSKNCMGLTVTFVQMLVWFLSGMWRLLQVALWKIQVWSAKMALTSEMGWWRAMTNVTTVSRCFLILQQLTHWIHIHECSVQWQEKETQLKYKHIWHLTITRSVEWASESHSHSVWAPDAETTNNSWSYKAPNSVRTLAI